MKARTLISICLISGLAAVAQSVPPSQKVAPDNSKAPMTKAAPAKSAPAAAAPTATQPKPVAPQAKPVTAAKPMTTKPSMPATSAKKAVAKPTTKAAAKMPVKQAKEPGKRDPFISPVREGGNNGPDCNVGKKCLAIETIQLKGIVRAPSGSIAVVESSTRKVTYFLRENDPVFNGYVVKITADTVTFRENVVDRFGVPGT